MINGKLKKRIVKTAVTILIVMAAVIFIISTIAKYLIEKYDEKLLGRRLEMSWIYVDPFTGFAYIKNLKMYEQKDDSIFISANRLSVNFSILKMLGKTYEINKVSLNKPVIRIIQNNKDLNFNDLIEKFTPEEKQHTTKDGLHFNILKIKINNGELHYKEQSIPVNYFIKDINIESTGIWWNVDTMDLKFSFISGPSTGDVKGNGCINVGNLNYRIEVAVNNYDLQIFQQYLMDLANYGSFSANLDANIKATGNIIDKENLNASGLITLNDLHFGKSAGDDYFSFSNLVLDISKLDPKGFKYSFDSIILTKPYLKYERYDHLDNIQRMFLQGGADIKALNDRPNRRNNLIIKIADYIKVLARNFYKSNYTVGSLAIYDGYFQFNDFSLNEKFSVAAYPCNIKSDSISKKNKRVEMFLKTDIVPFGNMSIDLSVNPNDTGDFDLIYHLNKVPLTLFNPYVITYTSYPLDRGTMELDGKWNVRKGKIQSVNHLLMIDPHLATRLKKNDANRLPMPLILAFIRENDNVIDYEIPITGDLKDPNFHLSDVVLDLLGNIFFKSDSVPFIAHINHFENEPENFFMVKWMMRQTTISPSQEEFLEKLKDLMKESPADSIFVTPVQYEEKEKEYILFYEAKKKYYLVLHNMDGQSFNKEDSLIVDKMSVKDSLFVHYINNRISDTIMFTIQEKCDAYLGETASTDSCNHSMEGRKIVDTQFSRLVKDREITFRSFFDEYGLGNRIKFQEVELSVPYNGFSFYKIVYKGKIPESLKKAYSQMNE